MPQQQERGQQTRQAIIDAARERFGRQGYEDTSIEAVLTDTGASRGSLYYHFKGKDELFRSVLEELQSEISTVVNAAARLENEPYDRLRAGCLAWIRLAKDEEIQQIALIDAPAVLGWQGWRAIDEHYTLAGLRQAVKTIAPEAGIDAELVEPLSYVLMASLNEAALYLTYANQDAIGTTEAVVEELLTRLFSPHGR